MKQYLTSLAAAAAIAAAGAGDASAQEIGLLKTVKDRGSLRCTGHNGSYLGFAEVDAQGAWQGFDIEFCRALATAILGDPEKAEIVPVSFAQRFPAIQSGDVDVIIKVTGWTMSRDTELGLQYSLPYFMGTFLSMARTELGAQGVADLEGGVFCVNSGTTVERVLADYMESRGIEYQTLAFEKSEELRSAFYAGRCDAIPGFSAFLTSTKANAPNPDDYTILDEVLALEPQGIVVRQGEDDFLDIVNWMISSMLMAEELGITSENVDEFRDNPPSATVERLLGVSPGIGERLGLDDAWAYDVIKQVGNYAEIYDRTIGDGSRYKLKRGLNNLWTNDGLLYPLVLD